MKVKYVYIVSIVVLVVAAFFSTGYHHIDEHIQILEFAGLKLNMTVADNLPWEYHYQMRPAIQPAIVVLISNLFSVVGIHNPFTITIFLRLLSAALAFAGMYLMYNTYHKTIQNDTLKKWFLLLSFFLWFVIYNGVRFSSEGWSGSLFLIAFALINSKQFPGRFSYLYAGFLFGLSFLCRFQTGILAAGLMLWYSFVKKETSSTLLLILGVLTVVGTGALIDRWFYGKWTLTAWNYFEQNIIQNKVSGYGTEPWWFYIEDVFIRAIPPFSIIFVASFVLVFIFKRKDILTWTILPFLFIHFMIGHKELRFLFPIIGFIPIVIIKATEIVQDKWNKIFLDNRYSKIFVKLFGITNIVFLTIIVFKPANDLMFLFTKIYSDYSEPTVLYYIDENPYQNIYYYRRKSLEVNKISSVEKIDLTVNKRQLFITKNIAIANKIKGHKKLIYSTLPDWAVLFNFNNWVERSDYFHLYEVY